MAVFGSILAVENRQPEQGGGEGSGAGAIYEVWKKSAVKGTHVRGVEKKGKSSMTKPKPKPKSPIPPLYEKSNQNNGHLRSDGVSSN